MSAARSLQSISRNRPALSRWMESDFALWSAFAAVHTILVSLGSTAHTFWYVWGDVDLYRWWFWRGVVDGIWPVFDEAWVYPVGALVPMGIAGVGAPAGTTGYLIAWVGLVVGLNAAVVLALVVRNARRAAWWWLAFLLFLGPIAISRLDTIICPLIILGLLHAVERPAVAATLLTVGAWIKVVPGAVYLVLAAVRRRGLRQILAPGALVTAVVVFVVWFGGGLDRLTSFLTEQTDRGLQVESVAATPWMIARLWEPRFTPRYDDNLLTYQMPGDGARTMASVLNPLLLVLVVVVLVLVWRAPRTIRTLVLASIVMLAGLIVTNKVGSPQFINWLATPVVAGLAFDEVRNRPGLRRLSQLVLVTALLTQLIYPWFYAQLIEGSLIMTAVLVVRNALVIAILVLTLRWLWLAARNGRVIESG